MSIKKNILVVYSTQVITIAISFLSAIFLSRILGAEGRGEQALFSNSIAFSSLLFGFSITSTITYFLNSGKIKLEKLFFSLLFFSLATSALLFVTLMIFKHFNLLSLALPEKYQHFIYIGLFVLGYFFTLYAGILSTFLTTYKVFKRQNVLILIPNILLLLFYILIYFKVLDYPILYTFNLVIGAFLFNAFVNLLIMYLVFQHEITLTSTFSLLSIDDIKLFVKYSLFAYLGNVAQFLSYRLDIWTVDRFCGKYNLGVYSQAITLLQMLWVLPNTFSSMLYAYASASTFANIREKAMQMIRFSLFSTLAVALVFLVFSYFMVPLLFGEQFEGSVNIIFILVSGYVLFSIPTTAGSLFAAYGYFRVNLYIGVGVSIVSIFLYYFFTKEWGIHGAAVASVISYCISTVVCIYLMYHYFSIRVSEIFNLSKDIPYFKLLFKKLISRVQ